MCVVYVLCAVLKSTLVSTGYKSTILLNYVDITALKFERKAVAVKVSTTSAYSFGHIVSRANGFVSVCTLSPNAARAVC